MSRLIAGLALAGIAGLWSWGLLTSKEPEPLPERYVGTYRLFRFEPPKGVRMDNPYDKQGQERFYTFSKDSTYAVSVKVMGGYEMDRVDGIVSVNRRGIMELRQVSHNLRAEPLEPDRYSVRFVHDPKGEVMVLTQVERRFELYLRRVPEGAGPAAN